MLRRLPVGFVVTVRVVAGIVDVVLWFVALWLLDKDQWLLGGLAFVASTALAGWATSSSYWRKFSDPLLYRRDDHFDR